MTESEIKLQAALNELMQAFNQQVNRAMNLAADNAVLQAKIAELSKPKEPDPE